MIFPRSASGACAFPGRTGRSTSKRRSARSWKRSGEIGAVGFSCHGNTILCSRGHGGRPQCAEITKDGGIVRVLRDFRRLKECTAVQILDDTGDPEKLCDCER